MISVIMGVYNSNQYLDKAIESILNQTFKNFEFIIINDGSTDNSLNTIKKYQKIDKRIKVINNNKNMGLTYSLNKGLQEAQYDYIARMDADDIAKKNRLEEQYNYLENNIDIIVLGSSAVEIDRSGKIIGKRNVPLSYKKIKDTIRIVNPLIHSSVMFRKKPILNIGGYNEKYIKVQDYDLWFRCLANDYKIVNIDKELLYYRRDHRYYDRKSFNYRWIDFKIRLNGYKLLKIPFYKWYTLFIPFILGILPKYILNMIYNNKNMFDPRED